jgi:hypothetical protein
MSRRLSVLPHLPMRCEDDPGGSVTACGSRGRAPDRAHQERVVVPNPETVLESLERFAATLTSGYGIGDVLHNLTEEMAEVLDLKGAGVTLVHDGKQRFVTAAVERLPPLSVCKRAFRRVRASTLSLRQPLPCLSGKLQLVGRPGFNASPRGRWRYDKIWAHGTASPRQRVVLRRTNPGEL